MTGRSRRTRKAGAEDIRRRRDDDGQLLAPAGAKRTAHGGHGHGDDRQTGRERRTKRHNPSIAAFAKFGAITAVGWLFLRAFEALSWIVLVALAIPWVDALSVWRGPTHSITEHHAAVFTKLSVAFVVPGGSAARLGLTDVMFFALFLGAAARFGLRPLATWLLMVTGLGVTIALTTFWSSGGLPALPAISLGFLLANGDLVWNRVARPALGRT